VHRSHSRRATEFRLQRLAQHGERPEAFDPPQARLDVQKRGGQPALFLIGGAPPIHLIGPLPAHSGESDQRIRPW